MRPRWLALAAALSLLVSPQLVRADDVQDQLGAMQTQMQQMEERLQATQDQLAATAKRADQQQELIQQAGLDAKAASGLSAFLDTLEVGGWVAGSYLWNFNDPNFQGGANTGLAGSWPLHPNHNSFGLDEVWFVLGKPATVESRAGFHAELVFGGLAGRLPGANVAAFDNSLYLMGYAEYLTSWGPKVTAGKFWTPVGAEVVGAPRNINISRGLVWSLFQPIDHEGVMVSGDLEGGFDYALGIVNSMFNATNPDNNSAKTFMGHAGWGDEVFSAKVNALYGNEVAGGLGNNSGEKTYIIDVVLAWDPSEDFKWWFNADYMNAEFPGVTGNQEAWGFATAARFALNDRLGVGGRLELVQDRDAIVTAGGPGSDLWSITGTVDYALTDHMMVRGELRWDKADIHGGPDATFRDNTGVIGKDHQVVSAVEVIYNF